MPNYLEAPRFYSRMLGRYVVGYYYWIFKNRGVKNIRLLDSGDCTALGEDDLAVFHYDDRSKVVCPDRSFKLCQVVSDRSYVKGCDFYILFDESCVRKDTLKTAFVLHPLPVGLKVCKPKFPPILFSFIGNSHTIIPELRDKRFLEDMKIKGLDIRLQYRTWNNQGDEDVFFCVRSPRGYRGHKTANRAYCAWYMNTPSIFSPDSAVMSIRKSEYDFLVASNVNEFQNSVELLRSDRSLFEKMVENCKKRADENNYDLVLRQFSNALRCIGFDFE